MKIKRRFRTAVGVLLILMLASGAQAATMVLDETAFIRGTERRIFLFDIVEGGLFKATLTDSEFSEPFDVLVPAILKGKEIVEDPLLGSGMFKFQAGPGIFATNFLKIIWDNVGFSLSRIKVPDEPIPTAALLLLIGLIALIALKRRRK